MCVCVCVCVCVRVCASVGVGAGVWVGVQLYLYGGQTANVKKSRMALITSAPVPRCWETKTTTDCIIQCTRVLSIIGTMTGGVIKCLNDIKCQLVSK